ncbi:hypothetical protein pb186bvf_005135 [Paramecium bursaria]
MLEQSYFSPSRHFYTVQAQMKLQFIYKIRYIQISIKGFSVLWRHQFNPGKLINSNEIQNLYHIILKFIYMNRLK